MWNCSGDLPLVQELTIYLHPMMVYPLLTSFTSYCHPFRCLPSYANDILVLPGFPKTH